MYKNRLGDGVVSIVSVAIVDRWIGESTAVTPHTQTQRYNRLQSSCDRLYFNTASNNTSLSAAAPVAPALVEFASDRSPILLDGAIRSFGQ
mmetsp:Transcript_12913/g.22967  ORF Transcript_12913/g.22967 Transcript_12913/m.22967 type:complete len:91 (+) Transcript_12913:1521-1793(+)